MRINQRDIILFLSGFLLITFTQQSCKQTDDTPPVITLVGDTLIDDHVLNVAYVDQGATATDETDGNITSSIYVENNVNENLMGEYEVIYKVVDQAGNEAFPVKRRVQVINQANPYIDFYSVFESDVYSTEDTCSYLTYVDVDSTINQRIILYGFACNPEYTCFVNILDTVLVLPYQQYTNSATTFTIYGSGWINDSTMWLDYTLKTAEETFYRNALFNRQNEK